MSDSQATPLRTSSPHARRRPHAARRASAYVFVLGVAMIVTVLGMGALTLSRVTARTTSDANDWEAAGSLAFSATEQAMSFLNTAAAAAPSTWRSGYVSGQTAFTQAIGRGQFSWAIKDEIDNNLSADYLRSFRVCGVGAVGNVKRVYSVQVAPGGTPLDVLRTAVHSSRNVTLTGTGQAVGGPISSNANVSLSGKVYGAIESVSTSGSATGTFSITAPSPVKKMPSATVLNDLLVNATALDYAVTGNTIQNCLISPGSNPYGAPNASGIYAITLPANKGLKITNCRIVGTLLVSGLGNNSLTLLGPVTWETLPGNSPILIVSAPGIDVVINGSNTWLTESDAGVNLNPASTPFQGQSNSTQADDFPPQYRGIIQIIGGSTGAVTLQNNTYIKGTLITDCPLKTKNQATLIQDPQYYGNPPFGYALGDVLTEVPGTWKWDAPP